jgi:hypothetical protein
VAGSHPGSLAVHTGHSQGNSAGVGVDEFVQRGNQERRYWWQEKHRWRFRGAIVCHTAVVNRTEMARSAASCRSAEKGVPVGTKTITMYVSDLDQSEIPAGQAYQLSIRHPDGSTQQLDISEKNYRDLKLAGVGKTLKKRGRKPGSTTAAGAPRTRRPRQNSKPAASA